MPTRSASRQASAAEPRSRPCHQQTPVIPRPPGRSGVTHRFLRDLRDQELRNATRRGGYLLSSWVNYA